MSSLLLYRYKLNYQYSNKDWILTSKSDDNVKLTKASQWSCSMWEYNVGGNFKHSGVSLNGKMNLVLNEFLNWRKATPAFFRIFFFDFGSVTYECYRVEYEMLVYMNKNINILY